MLGAILRAVAVCIVLFFAVGALICVWVEGRGKD